MLERKSKKKIILLTPYVLVRSHNNSPLVFRQFQHRVCSLEELDPCYSASLYGPKFAGCGSGKNID